MSGSLALWLVSYALLWQNDKSRLSTFPTLFPLSQVVTKKNVKGAVGWRQLIKFMKKTINLYQNDFLKLSSFDRTIKLISYGSKLQKWRSCTISIPFRSIIVSILRTLFDLENNQKNTEWEFSSWPIIRILEMAIGHIVTGFFKWSRAI